MQPMETPSASRKSWNAGGGGGTAGEAAQRLHQIGVEISTGHRPDGSCSIVKALVARSDGAAVVNALSNRRTPLHVAVAAGRAEICRILVEHKADTLAPDSAGQTPLQLAQKRPKDCSSYRDDPIVELLRKATPKLSR